MHLALRAAVNFEERVPSPTTPIRFRERHRDDPGFSGPFERAAWSAARALAGRPERLDDAWYAEARAALGEAVLFELSTLVGYYATLALQLRLFGVPAPDKEPQP
ncbi:hypothetical protein [Streptomyces humi]|uniref:hypothetical protein n=1 Tax=Streptomyces humi TaxID=1428620 RepID=UPI00069C95DC|nr:hypothetical protein [Streptomyces humi]